MADSLSIGATSSFQALTSSRIDAQNRIQASSSVGAGNDGPDKENDGDADDGASVTPTRGQNVNVLA